MKRHVLSILLLSCVTLPAQAGLFSDDEARKHIQEVEKLLLTVQGRVTQAEETLKNQEEVDKQTIKTNVDFQMQIDAIKSDLQKAYGQKEELAYRLNDIEKRQKDFYIDLDTRLRFIEEQKEKEQQAKKEAEVVVDSNDPHDPAAENRAYETAYGLFKSGKHTESIGKFNEFLAKFPNSVHTPNVYYWLGEAQFALKDFKAAQVTYSKMLKDYPNTPKEPEALFNLAGSQGQSGNVPEAKKSLQLLLKKYPKHALAAKAKSLLDAL